jgi:hypothetical protein
LSTVFGRHGSREAFLYAFDILENKIGTKQPIRNVGYHVRLQGCGGYRTRRLLRPELVESECDAVALG